MSSGIAASVRGVPELWLYVIRPMPTSSAPSDREADLARLRDTRHHRVVTSSTTATPAGVELTAEILDDLLARRTVAGKPDDLSDDLAWVRAASGRAEHDDPRLPLIG